MFLWPSGCIDNITQECLEQEKEEKEQHIRDREKGRIDRLRNSYLRSFVKIIFIAFCGYVAAYLINTYYPVTQEFITGMRVVASLLIAWAVFSKLSKEIESWGGDSIPEQLNALVFKINYFLGISMVICTLYLVSVPEALS